MRNTVLRFHSMIECRSQPHSASLVQFHRPSHPHQGSTLNNKTKPCPNKSPNFISEKSLIQPNWWTFIDSRNWVCSVQGFYWREECPRGRGLVHIMALWCSWLRLQFFLQSSCMLWTCSRFSLPSVTPLYAPVTIFNDNPISLVLIVLFIRTYRQAVEYNTDKHNNNTILTN